MSSSLEKQSVVVFSTTTTNTPNPPPNFSHEYLQGISLHLQTHETTGPHLETLGLVPFSSIFHTSKQINSGHSSPMQLHTEARDHHHFYSSSLDRHKGRKKIKMVSHQEDREGKRKKQSSRKSGSTTEGMRKLKTTSEAKKKQNEGAAADDDRIQEAPTGFVRVRARRGQATDSHSLAERARREKISVRMKLLQSLVPGCDKITGKAHILDEIINYVQSLQKQVECLAAKLASVDPMLSHDFKLGPLITGTLTDDQGQCCLEPPLCGLQESSSTQFRCFADNAPTSVSLVVSADQRPTVVSQDDGNLFFGLDDHSENIISQCGFDNLCSF
ncbi:hypothetical protein FEM48_Zijuj10G0172700 [Ziziphus jujuba var. spinosa]|uniref:BHLH domain-containing protein n=1 Tax=Ziziphus jujuba var. spinosa TaxID=714518 RepID=A0A978UPP4_ZIZJJ|nr:hypothetical protein FEM48_Zijuj10G0172700 [Ziziphus jujuba var. spinosa]